MSIFEKSGNGYTIYIHGTVLFKHIYSNKYCRKSSSSPITSRPRRTKSVQIITVSHSHYTLHITTDKCWSLAQSIMHQSRDSLAQCTIDTFTAQQCSNVKCRYSTGLYCAVHQYSQLGQARRESVAVSNNKQTQ